MCVCCVHVFVLRPPWGGRPTYHHVKLVPMALPDKGRSLKATTTGTVVWETFCQEHRLPPDAWSIGSGTRFATHDEHRPSCDHDIEDYWPALGDDVGPGQDDQEAKGQGKGQEGHAPEGQGKGQEGHAAKGQGKGQEGHMAKGHNKGQGKVPGTATPEVLDLVRRWRDVREVAGNLGVRGVEWVQHVETNYNRDAQRAHADHLSIPQAQRDPVLDAARNMVLMTTFVFWHGHPDGPGLEQDALLPVLHRDPTPTNQGPAMSVATTAPQPGPVAATAIPGLTAQGPATAAAIAFPVPGHQIAMAAADAGSAPGSVAHGPVAATASTTGPCPWAPSSPGPLPQGMDAVSQQLAQISEQLAGLVDIADSQISSVEDQLLACQQKTNALQQMRATVSALPITATDFGGSTGSQDSCGPAS